MAEQQPFAVSDLCYSAGDFRLLNEGLVCAEGVSAFSSLHVVETSPVSGSVLVSLGHAFIFAESDPANNGAYHVYNDDTASTGGPGVTLDVPLNSTGSDRTDVVWARVCDSDFAAVTSGFTLVYDDDNPTAIPPADGCTYYLLATIVVPNGAGTGGANITGFTTYFGDTDGMITDERTPFRLCGDDGGWVDGSATLDFPSISANGGRQTGFITVPGATVGDEVALGAPTGLAAGLVWNGYVSATDTVAVQVTNCSGSPIDPASATWHVAVRTR